MWFAPSATRERPPSLSIDEAGVWALLSPEQLLFAPRMPALIAVNVPGQTRDWGCRI